MPLPWGAGAVAVAGELADGWFPFLLPVSALGERIGRLSDGAARAGRPVPRICPCIPVAVSPDPAASREIASWWVAFYLTRMGPLYRRTLRRLGFATAVDEVVAAGATPEVPPSADVLLDELTLWGDATAGRAGLDRWFAAGAQMPVLALPPHRSVDELDHILESLRPSVEAVP